MGRRARRRPLLERLKANSFFTKLRTWLRGEFVAEDLYGNRY
jgi:hypothetical protein